MRKHNIETVANGTSVCRVCGCYGNVMTTECFGEYINHTNILAQIAEGSLDYTLELGWHDPRDIEQKTPSTT